VGAIRWRRRYRQQERRFVRLGAGQSKRRYGLKVDRRNGGSAGREQRQNDEIEEVSQELQVNEEIELILVLKGDMESPALRPGFSFTQRGFKTA
jgi:hypothetical protein